MEPSTSLEYSIHGDRLADNQSVNDKPLATDREDDGDLSVVPAKSEKMWSPREDTKSDLVGNGFYGTVYRAYMPGRTRPVAAKLLHRKMSQGEIDALCDRVEISVAKWTRRPSMVSFLGLYYAPPYLYIITEFMRRGTLREAGSSRSYRSRPFVDRLCMMLDMARAVSGLHSIKPGFVHGNLTSRNVYIDREWHCKVGDFIPSFLLDIPADHWRGEEGSPQKPGNLRWLAPECVRGQPYTLKSDMFSCGLIMWEMLTGELPLSLMSDEEASAAMTYDGVRPSLPVNIPDSLAVLIKQCWQQDPQQRPNIVFVCLELLRILGTVDQEKMNQRF